MVRQNIGMQFIYRGSAYVMVVSVDDGKKRSGCRVKPYRKTSDYLMVNLISELLNGSRPVFRGKTLHKFEIAS